MDKNPLHTDDFLFDDDFNEYVREGSSIQKKKWNKYFKDFPETKPGAKKARQIISGLSSLNDNVCHKEITESQLNEQFEKTWLSYKDSKSKAARTNASRLVWRSLAVAAAIAVAVIFYSVMENFVYKNNKPEYFEVYVPAAKQSQLILPDSTKVWINSDTKIRYSSRFNSGERDIFLTGEAYFEVYKNKRVPFKVYANGAEIKALGTKFNIKSYAGDIIVETALLEGRVKLGKAGSPESGSIEMEPGNKAIFNLKTNKVAISQSHVKEDVAWKDGKIVFRNTPLSEICETLSRRFDAEVIPDGNTSKLLQHQLTFTVVNETLPLVLDYLCQAAPLQYTTTYIDEDGEKGIEKIIYTIRLK